MVSIKKLAVCTAINKKAVLSVLEKNKFIFFSTLNDDFGGTTAVEFLSIKLKLDMANLLIKTI